MTPTLKTCLLLSLATAPIAAQTSASLSGAVTDASGGAVQSAAVTVTNSGTGAVRNTVTDEAGRYQVSALPVGDYEVRAAKTGFSDELRKGIHLVVGQSATVDLTMQVGQTSQTV